MNSCEIEIFRDDVFYLIFDLCSTFFHSFHFVLLLVFIFLLFLSNSDFI